MHFDWIDDSVRSRHHHSHFNAGSIPERRRWPRSVGGGGKFGGGMMTQDPNTLFEFYAKGRPYFLVSETRMLREPLTQYAQQKNITTGQITRQQFVEFSEQMKAKSGG
jgi:hypothetical protein